MPFAAPRVAAAIAVVAAIVTLSFGANATTVYSSRTAFFNAISASLTDDYQDPAYEQPDNPNGTFTDAGMSGIFGETRYTTTGLAGRNIVEYQAGEGLYCAGCNGSFLLDFTETSIGSANGVYAAGVNVIVNRLNFPYVAFVTYGDNTTENFSLPIKNSQTRPPPTTFWGIISGKQIRSIHFGGYNGAAVTTGGFAIDNLTIGAIIPTDTDADGVLDIEDNCTDEPNGPQIPDEGGNSQLDADGDGYGNICDADLNNTGLVTSADYTMLRMVLNQLASSSPTAAAADMNGTGRVTTKDYTLLRNALNLAPGPSGLHP